MCLFSNCWVLVNIISEDYLIAQVFAVAQTIKNLPAMQETQVQFLGQEDPLEKGIATHSSILAQRIPWTEEPGGYSPWVHKESDMTKQVTHFLS